MPTYFMPAKDPEEVKQFFQDMVQQGKLKVVLATERPDVYSRISPTEEVHLVVDTADKTPPEGADFDRVLSEFRPTPLPEDQVASWSVKEPEQSEALPEAGEESEQVVEIPPATEEHVEESEEVAETLDNQAGGHGILDKPWTPFTSRGFKG